MTDKESSLFHNAKIRDICVFINKYLYFVSGFFNSCLQPSGLRLTQNLLHQGLQHLFCCHNLVLAWGSSCSQILVEKKALEAFKGVYLSFCLNRVKKPALIMDDRYLVKESLIYQLWSVYCTVKFLCGEKEICCHPQGILFAEAISFCQCNTSCVFATEPIKCVFKACSPIQAASQTKPHIWICIIWSWSHPKASTYQGSDFPVVFTTARQESSWVFCMKE